MWLGADRPGQPLTGKLQHTLTVVADEELASPTFAVEFAAPVPVLDGRRSAHLELNHHCGSRARAHCRRLRGAESPKRVQINQVGVPYGDRAPGARRSWLHKFQTRVRAESGEANSAGDRDEFVMSFFV